MPSSSWFTLLGLGCLVSVASGSLDPVVLVTAGTPQEYTDAAGNVWMGDPVTQGGRNNKAGIEVLNTDEDGLYQTYRSVLAGQGSLYYDVDAPNGIYTVQLHFAEFDRTRAGTRVFDILMEGSLVEDSYDCFVHSGGPNIADILEYRNVEITDGVLNLEFQPQAGQNGHTMISAVGIYIDTRTPSPTASPTTGKPSAGPSAAPTVDADLYQPRVINVEAYPPGKAQGFIGIPGGSPWCDGGAVYWWSGHDNRPEEPFCQLPDGTWDKKSSAILDRQDELNIIDGPTFIDRHDCVAMDANHDGVDDIICVVGANKGTGNGYNEVYYTQPDGTIERQMQDVGLYKYPTMRTRLVKSLKAADGSNMIMVTTTHGARADNQTNAHHMWKLNADNWFDEVVGPFVQEFTANCLEVVDLNNDGIDDLIICDEDSYAQAYIQDTEGSWTKMESWEARDPYYMIMWNGVRVADVTGDGINDLLVAGPFKAWNTYNPDPYVRVYRGAPGLDTLFDFDNPVLNEPMPFHAMDVEVIDLNGDGLLDMYVVQWNLTLNKGGYCEMPNNWRDWWGDMEGHDGHDFPPANFAPPPDTAPDFLYLSVDGESWDVVEMEHAIPGCGSRVQKWEEFSLAVAHGHLSRPGYNVILDWSVPPDDTPTMAPVDVPTMAPFAVDSGVPTQSIAPSMTPTIPRAIPGWTAVALINAGYFEPYTDLEGRVWSPDLIPLGDTANNGWRHNQDPDTDILGTEDDQLYRYHRYKLSRDGSLFYSIENLDSGVYKIELHFAELRKSGSGQRTFNILVEGSLVEAAFDCFDRVDAADTAYVLEIAPTSVTDGTLNLEFEPVRGHAMVAAIGVFKES